MAVTQERHLSPLDRLRRILAWTLAALAAPILAFVAYVVLAEILIIFILLLSWWFSN